MRPISFKVIIVKVISNGSSDQAVFLNGKNMLSVDPSAGDDASKIDILANNLSLVLGCEEPQTRFWNAPEDWCWDECPYSATELR